MPPFSSAAIECETLTRCTLCDGSHLEPADPACNIVQCRDCGLVFDNPRPSAAALIAYYSTPGKYDDWLRQLDIRDALWKRRLRKLNSTRRPGSLLDVGAGIGQFLSLASACYDRVYGTEVSSTAVAVAKEKYGLDLFHGTVEELASQSCSFDNITLFHVLEHVPYPKQVLAACYKLLSPEGILAIAVPNEVASLRGWQRRVRMKLGVKKPSGLGALALPLIRLDGTMHEVHLSHFTPRALRRLLTESGFSVVSSTLDPYYVSNGGRRVLDDVYYACCSLIASIFRVNIYDTILMIARKDAGREPRAKQTSHGRS